MKLDKLYPLPVAFNSKLLERLEKESLHTIEDGVTCLHFMLDMNYEKIKNMDRVQVGHLFHYRSLPFV